MIAVVLLVDPWYNNLCFQQIEEAVSFVCDKCLATYILTVTCHQDMLCSIKRELHKTYSPGQGSTVYLESYFWGEDFCSVV